VVVKFLVKNKVDTMQSTQFNVRAGRSGKTSAAAFAGPTKLPPRQGGYFRMRKMDLLGIPTYVSWYSVILALATGGLLFWLLS